VTAIVVGICVAIQALVFIFDFPLNQFTLNALLVIYAHQVQSNQFLARATKCIIRRGLLGLSLLLFLPLTITLVLAGGHFGSLSRRLDAPRF
jgi:hypothetical protein